MKGRKKLSLYILILVVFLIALVNIIKFISESYYSKKAEDSRIISCIGQARGIMSDIYDTENNYDNFNCNHKEMVDLCWDIDYNYGEEDNKEPTIAHGAIENSQAACIYSPLNRKENHWYCVDSKGHIGFTEIDPGSSGHCVDGKTATCPPLLKNLP